MARHQFEVKYTGTAQATLSNARAGLEAHGGNLIGDETRGELIAVTPVGEVKGTYRVNGQTIAIEIIEKPFVVPASLIESQVRRFLQG
ncbi:MAG: hypothetical protein JNL21_41960 [Myxococcales bacterium]|nr:hypothetical protein [Myxococcales bacterium]